ncbi:MAG: hypothetical protein HY738_07730 [Bacteroidia bacterium]|nr:hypothetical protein [Bacteroidia bacterium]
MVFRTKAKSMNAPLFFADKKYSVSHSKLINNTDISPLSIYKEGKGVSMTMNNKQSFNIIQNNKLVYKNLEIDLVGLYQKKNIITTIAAIEFLSKKIFSISKNAIYSGLKNASKQTSLMGRWQIIGKNPLIICDTGHNEAGIKAVLEQINMTPHKQLHFIFGMVSDKDIDKILQILPKNAIYYFTKASIPRALDEKILVEKAWQYDLKGSGFSTVREAVTAAKQKAYPEDLIFIGGSTFIVAEAIP